MLTPDLDAIRAIRAVLDDASASCRYHGIDFGKLGWAWGEPRCDSCKQPWRVVRAREALNRLYAAATAPGPPAALIESPAAQLSHPGNPPSQTEEPEPESGDLFTAWRTRSLVAAEIAEALRVRSRSWPDRHGQWWDGWRGGLLDGADTASVHGMPPQMREQINAAMDKALFGDGGAPKFTGILGAVDPHGGEAP